MFVSTDRRIPADLAARVRPVVAARQRLLPVPGPLVPLLPDGALQRGTTVLVAGAPAAGAVTLALSLLAGASSAGGWCAVVGLAGPGVVAMAELGIDLAHLALVPRPGPAWAEVAGELLGAVDVVAVRPPFRPGLTAARHLSARARQQRTALVVLGAAWPGGADVTLGVEEAAWVGLGDGHGHLAGRRARVRATARRLGGREQRHQLWLPGGGGELGAAG